MRKLHYCLVDVFTDRAFGGNPLAIFTDANNLSPVIMQALAKELNLSETSFVLPAHNPTHDYAVRIFTPAIELPMAGHPTIGTAFVLAHEHMISTPETETTVLFEEGVGIIPVTLISREGHLQTIQMSQPLPTFGSQFVARETIAQMLSLDLADLNATLPLEVVSCGVPFLFVPVNTLEAMRSIQFRRDVWERVLRDFEAPHVFAFTEEVVAVGSTVHSRMFAPAMGISEDPATGAASGPLGCFLVHHKRVKPAKIVEIVSEQGLELGRPSFIQVRIEQEEEQITGVYVGGQCYWMGQGTIEIHESETLS
jgi:trans-2,3-dihydro-3-hydroxyanthranilate isomerase